MNYVRAVDIAAIDGSGPDDRFTQTLFDHTSGAKTCAIRCIKTPAGVVLRPVCTLTRWIKFSIS